MVKVGDSIPSIQLVEKNPHDEVNIATEIGSGNAVIIGVPAAFSEFSLSCHRAQCVQLVSSKQEKKLQTS
jgi:2-Cys peroxiredoxin 5